MNLGIIILAISAVGYVSNWLNGRFLNHRITHLLYYIGTIVHETSHAIMCVFTGARIQEFHVFSRQPQVVHTKSKIPLLGAALISSAPIAGGLAFLFLVNHFLLGDHFAVSFAGMSWNDLLPRLLSLIRQLNPLEWQSWVILALFLNIGAIIGPSYQDLKNMWPALVVMFFIHSGLIASIGLLAIGLILVNIAIQI